MKISIKSIIEKSKDRPAGYYEDVISRASFVNEEYIEISRELFIDLKFKYNSKEVPQGEDVPQYESGPRENPEMPSLFQMAKNLTKSTFNHVMNGMEEVSDDIYEERLRKCNNCPLLNTANAENPSCSKCGCFVKIKAKWASESCPKEEKEWLAIPTQKNGGCGSCGDH